MIAIGGGSAGYSAARAARDAGLRVAVVDGGERLGGLCILRGCMPTKTLLHAADVLHTVRHHAADLGLAIPEAGFDWEKVYQRKDALVADWAEYRAGQLEDDRLHLVRGTAHFIDEHTLGFDDGSSLTAAHFVIATGSKVSAPPLDALARIGCIDSDDALRLVRPPKSMIVLGAGAVAVELAQFFARMDVKVTVIQRSEHVLSPFDTDAAEVVESVFRREGMDVFTGTRLLDATAGNEGKTLTFEHDGVVRTVTAESVLLALGRSPNTAGLALENAGVETDRSGRIEVNARQQSSAPHIYAAGDCCGPHEIVHLAVNQGEVAARNIIGEGMPLEMDYRLLISVVFTEPQVATVGLTEKQCREQGIPYLADSYPFGDHGKSVIFHANDGFVKMIAHAGTGEILGACCTGPHGGELIHEVMVAMHSRMTVHDFALLPHYHPTLAEIWTYPAEELAERIGDVGVRRQDDALFRGDMSPRNKAQTCLRTPKGGDMSPGNKAQTCPRTPKFSTAWHHAPLHLLGESGIYMVTAGTIGKEHFFHDAERLDLLHTLLLEYAKEFGWEMQAWSVFPNHYHFVAASPENPGNLGKFLGKLHMKTAQAVNRLDGTEGRKVWHQFWDSHITFENSYWPRLRYVQENAVKHGVVNVASDYPWCSAGWFERTAESAVRRKLASYKIDKLEIGDEF